MRTKPQKNPPVPVSVSAVMNENDGFQWVTVYDGSHALGSFHENGIGLYTAGVSPHAMQVVEGMARVKFMEQE